MIPDTKYIIIDNNLERIKQLIFDLVLEPRMKALMWSTITGQTPNMKVGYPGQHLASLIVGMPGSKTGARGNDIVDGTEVKSCSRVDSLDKCVNCGEKVSRSETVCSICGSTNIKRDNTSKWLFTIRNERDLEVLLDECNRILLVLADYPNFHENDFSVISFQAWEIWPNSERCSKFRDLMTNYYNNIYLPQRESDPSKVPAPKNLWPYSYQFYMCNPIKVFSCNIVNANTKPEIEDIYYVEPNIDRNYLQAEGLPSKSITKAEIPDLFEMVKNVPEELLNQKIKPGATIDQLKTLLGNGKINSPKLKQGLDEILPVIDEDLKKYLSLRPDKYFTIKTTHIRK